MKLPPGTVIILPNPTSAEEFREEFNRCQASAAPNTFDATDLEINPSPKVVAEVTLQAGECITCRTEVSARRVAAALAPHAALHSRENRVILTWPLMMTIVGMFERHRQIVAQAEPNAETEVAA